MENKETQDLSYIGSLGNGFEVFNDYKYKEEEDLKVIVKSIPNNSKKPQSVSFINEQMFNQSKRGIELSIPYDYDKILDSGSIVGRTLENYFDRSISNGLPILNGMSIAAYMRDGSINPLNLVPREIDYSPLPMVNYSDLLVHYIYMFNKSVSHLVYTLENPLPGIDSESDVEFYRNAAMRTFDSLSESFILPSLNFAFKVDRFREISLKRAYYNMFLNSLKTHFLGKIILINGENSNFSKEANFKIKEEKFEINLRNKLGLSLTLKKE